MKDDLKNDYGKNISLQCSNCFMRYYIHLYYFSFSIGDFTVYWLFNKDNDFNRCDIISGHEIKFIYDLEFIPFSVDENLIKMLLTFS